VGRGLLYEVSDFVQPRPPGLLAVGPLYPILNTQYSVLTECSLQKFQQMPMELSHDLYIGMHTKLTSTNG